MPPVGPRAQPPSRNRDQHRDPAHPAGRVSARAEQAGVFLGWPVCAVVMEAGDLTSAHPQGDRAPGRAWTPEQARKLLIDIGYRIG